MKSNLPKLSVIIPAYNEAECIERCLMACIAQTEPIDEIIVVDNKSKDDTAKVVKKFIKANKKYPIKIVNEFDQQGLIPARNTGMRCAKYEVMGRIDADTILEHEWAHVVKDIFVDESVSAATGPVSYHDMPARKTTAKVDNQIRTALNKMAKDHRFIFGSNMAVRKAAWGEIKGDVALDPKDLLHEDIDIALCLFKKDLRIAYNPKMRAGMSARRLEDNPRDFFSYVMRFERTFRHHDISSVSARIPIFIYLSVYFPTKIIRSVYDPKKQRFTTTKIKKMLVDRIKELDIY